MFIFSFFAGHTWSGPFELCWVSGYSVSAWGYQHMIVRVHWIVRIHWMFSTVFLVCTQTRSGEITTFCCFISIADILQSSVVIGMRAILTFWPVLSKVACSIFSLKRKLINQSNQNCCFLHSSVLISAGTPESEQQQINSESRLWNDFTVSIRNICNHCSGLLCRGGTNKDFSIPVLILVEDISC